MKKITTTKPESISLHELFHDLQGELEAHLRTGRRNIKHPGTKGDVTESNWIKMLAEHLPRRYSVDKGIVVDSKGQLSQQIDLVVYDNQYCPLVFHANGATYVPAEGVYAVFEVKQELNAKYVKEAIEKAESVRRLKRTSVDITSAAGRHKARKPIPIIAGILTYESAWKSGFGAPFRETILKADVKGRLDIGCCLRLGAFNIAYGRSKPDIRTSDQDVALVSFFMTLLHRLQPLGTVTAIDLTAYGDFTLAKRHGSRRSKTAG